MTHSPRCKHTVPWRTCRKAALFEEKKRREKIQKLLTTEPHPALIQSKNERAKEEAGEKERAEKPQRTKTMKIRAAE